MLKFVSMANADNYAAEAFRIGQSVQANGTQGQLNSAAFSPSNFLAHPANANSGPQFSIEAASLPILGGASQMVLGAAQLQLPSQVQVSIASGIVSTSEIGVRPLLQGTYEERLVRPELRPGDCSACPELRDRVYVGYLNLQRTLNSALPRIGIESRPIPFEFAFGITPKFFWEELEGDSYRSQALNLDAGMEWVIHWDWDPSLKKSDRDFKIRYEAFEFLPTKQVSTFASGSAEELISIRQQLVFQWEEGIPKWESHASASITPVLNSYIPGIGAEWNFRNALFLRAGYAEENWSMGISLVHRVLALHYALVSHPLGYSVYQISLQIHRGP